MPCNCDYMEPNKSEKNSKEVAELLCYVFGELGKPIKKEIKEASKNTYGNPGKLNEMTVLLCKTITDMDPTQMQTIVYNGRDKNSRRLADWWEIHEEADQKRIEKEKKEEKENSLVASAKEKLTKEEFEAIKKTIKRNKM